jgi:hypothetical protein
MNIDAPYDFLWTVWRVSLLRRHFSKQTGFLLRAKAPPRAFPKRRVLHVFRVRRDASKGESEGWNFAC